MSADLFLNDDLLDYECSDESDTESNYSHSYKYDYDNCVVEYTNYQRPSKCRVKRKWKHLYSLRLLKLWVIRSTDLIFNENMKIPNNRRRNTQRDIHKEFKELEEMSQLTIVVSNN